MKIETAIRQKLTRAFSPAHLQVLNESHMHSVPANSETHFKVVVVSAEFAGLRQVQRHQRVYGLLADELKAGVHALSIHTYTEDEWQNDVPASPECLGGSKKS